METEGLWKCEIDDYGTVTGYAENGTGLVSSVMETIWSSRWAVIPMESVGEAKTT